MVTRQTLVFVINIQYNHGGGNGDYWEVAVGNWRMLVLFLYFRFIVFLAD